MIALLIILANAADLLTFYCAMAILPPSVELNPVARWLYEHYGLWGVGAYKAAGVATIIGLLALLPDGYATWIVSFAIVVAMLGAASNTFAVLKAAAVMVR